MTPTPELPVASLWRRLAAMVYDGLLLLAIWFAVGAAAVAIKANLVGAETIRASHKAALEGPLVLLPLILVTYLFLGLCWTRSGQTLGMKTWHIRVISDDGRPLNWLQSAIRLAVATLSLSCLGLGYFWALVDPAKATWHDRASRSRVIRLPKP